jgi:hypothetical protein
LFLLFFAFLLGIGGERSLTTRMRLAGKICCFCGRYLGATLSSIGFRSTATTPTGSPRPEKLV